MKSNLRLYYMLGILIAFLITAIAKSRTEYRNNPTGLFRSGRNRNRVYGYDQEFEMEPMYEEAD
jgi:hypothetical protein